MDCGNLEKTQFSLDKWIDILSYSPSPNLKLWNLHHSFLSNHVALGFVDNPAEHPINEMMLNGYYTLYDSHGLK